MIMVWSSEISTPWQMIFYAKLIETQQPSTSWSLQSAEIFNSAFSVGTHHGQPDCTSVLWDVNWFALQIRQFEKDNHFLIRSIKQWSPAQIFRCGLTACLMATTTSPIRRTFCRRECWFHKPPLNLQQPQTQSISSDIQCLCVPAAHQNQNGIWALVCMKWHIFQRKLPYNLSKCSKVVRVFTKLYNFVNRMRYRDGAPKLTIAQLASATTSWLLVASSMPIEWALTLPSPMCVCGSKSCCLWWISSFAFLPIWSLWKWQQPRRKYLSVSNKLGIELKPLTPLTNSKSQPLIRQRLWLSDWSRCCHYYWRRHLLWRRRCC